MSFHSGEPVDGNAAGAPGAAAARPNSLPAVGAAALTVLLYANTLDNPFVYDDFRLIVENEAIQNLSSVLAVFVRDITRPLVDLSYIVDTLVWGTQPFGYHLTNVLLHAVNVVLVFRLAFGAADDWRRRGLGAPGPAVSPVVVATATSLLVAAHPVMSQAVGYITARSELLYGTCFLAACLAGRRWMHAGGWWRSVTLAWWVLALLAKETAAVLPLVLWSYDAWIVRGDPGAYWARVKRLYAPLTLVVVLFGVGRLAVLASLEYPEGVGPDWRYGLVALDAFWRYLRLFVWPNTQTLMHVVPFVTGITPRVGLEALGVVALAGAVWRLRRVQGVAAFGLVLSVAILVPGSVLFIAGIGEPMAEHRAYLSAAGFFLTCGVAFATAWAWLRAAGRGTIVLAALSGVLLVQCAGLTFIRNSVWGSSVLLAQEAVVRAPDHWMPRLFLGETLRQNGRCGEAETEYRVVVHMRPRETFAYTKLLSCLLQTGKIGEAETVMHRLRTVDPRSEEAAMGLGLVAAARGNADQSRQYFQEVVARRPTHPEARRFVALLDGTLAGAERTSACGMVRALASAIPASETTRSPLPCP